MFPFVSASALIAYYPDSMTKLALTADVANHLVACKDPAPVRTQPNHSCGKMCQIPAARFSSPQARADGIPLAGCNHILDSEIRPKARGKSSPEHA